MQDAMAARESSVLGAGARTYGKWNSRYSTRLSLSKFSSSYMCVFFLHLRTVTDAAKLYARAGAHNICSTYNHGHSSGLGRSMV